MTHELKIIWPTSRGNYVSECRCGWQSPIIPNEWGAKKSHEKHAERAAPLPDPGLNTVGKMHRNAHVTERGAAFKTMPRTGTQRERILSAIAAAGFRGLIDEEIAALPGVADTAHRTRRNELVAGGWVEDSGKVRLTGSNTESIIWRLTQRGRLELGVE